MSHSVNHNIIPKWQWSLLIPTLHIPHNESDQKWRACNWMWFGSLDDEQPTNWALSFASRLGPSNQSVNTEYCPFLALNYNINWGQKMLSHERFAAMLSVLLIYLTLEWAELFDLSVIKSCNRELSIISISIKCDHLLPVLYLYKLWLHVIREKKQKKL